MEIKQLNNGLTIILFERDNTSPAVFSAYIKVGSRLENNDNNGIVHFAEHVFITKLEENYLSNPKNTWTDASYIKNSDNFTTKEFTCFNFSTKKDQAEEIAKNLKQTLENFTISEKTFSKEKNIILNELAAEKDNFFYDSDMDFSQKYYKNNSLVFDAIGTDLNIKKTNKDTIENLINSFYVPSKMVIVMTKEKSTDYVIKILEQLEARKFKNTTLNKPQKFKGVSKNTLNTFYKKSELIYFSLFKSFSIDKYETVVKWEFFQTIIENYLWNILKTEKAYVYDVNVSLSKYSDFFNIFIDAETQKNTLTDFYAELTNAIKDIANNITEKQFIKLKEKELADIKETETDAEEIASLIGGQAILYGTSNILTPKNIANIINKMTIQDMQNMATKFNQAKFFIHLTGDIDDEYNLKKLNEQK